MTEKSSALLSIIVPVFNEEEVLSTFIETVSPILDEAISANNLDGTYEIIFIDDGSSDKTHELICEIAQKNPRIKEVKLSRNFGKDSALTAGLQYATGQAIIPMDVDLQDPPEIIPEMVKLWTEGAKVVNAVRSNRDSDGFLKRRLAIGFYKFYNKISPYKIDENVGDYRLMDREVIDVINTLPEKVRFMKGIFSWVGYSRKNIEFVRQERVAGTTKWKFWGLWNFALDGITGATTIPLRIWTYLGAVTAFFAFLYAFIILFRTLFYGVDVPGYASLLTVVLIFGGLNMIAFGIIGEYIGRIAIETKQRPIYVIESTLNLPK